LRCPRGALTAMKLTDGAFFLAFGTNDDAARGLGMSATMLGFLPCLPELEDRQKNPFATSYQLECANGSLWPCRRIKRAPAQSGHLREHGGRPVQRQVLATVPDCLCQLSPYPLPWLCLAAAQLVEEEQSKKKKGNSKIIRLESSEVTLEAVGALYSCSYSGPRGLRFFLYVGILKKIPKKRKYVRYHRPLWRQLATLAHGFILGARHGPGVRKRADADAQAPYSPLQPRVPPRGERNRAAC